MCKWCNPKYQEPSEAQQRADIGWAEERAGKHEDDVTVVVRSGKSTRKNTKRWCKGKVGREHVLEWGKDHWFMSHKYGCRWMKDWDGAIKYRCYHTRVCKNCSKILERGIYDQIGEKCPDFHTVETA